MAELTTALAAERDENTCRESLAPTLKVELAQEIEIAFGPQAEAAKEEGRKRGGKTAGRGRPKANSFRESFPKAKQDDAKRARAQGAAAAGVSHPAGHRRGCGGSQRHGIRVLAENPKDGNASETRKICNSARFRL